MVVGGARMVAIALCYMFDASKKKRPQSRIGAGEIILYGTIKKQMEKMETQKKNDKMVSTCEHRSVYGPSQEPRTLHHHRHHLGALTGNPH